jgi:hypothetical protein
MIFTAFGNILQSRWKVAGIILSILWIIGSMYYEYSTAEISAKNFSEFSSNVCLKSIEVNKSTDLAECSLKKQQDFDMWMRNVWPNAFSLAFLPLPFLWIYGFILLTISRCFVNGSRNELNFQGLSKTKKLFYYFCFGFSGLTVLFCIIVLMNVYTDSKVPAQLGYKTSFIETENTVIVEGTFTSASDLPDSLKNTILFPQQTSKIVCDKNEKKCFESKAMISHTGNSPYLLADLIEYEITSWTKDNIVFVQRNLCFDSIFNLDLNSKILSGVEKYANNTSNDTFCIKPDKNDSNVTFKLSDGFTVHQQLRREASPWLLKVVYSIFGN